MHAFFVAVEVFVRVFDHDDGGVDDDADGDGDSAQGHDVGVDADEVHDQKRDNDGTGDDEDGNEFAAGVEEEENADDADDDDFFNECVAEGGEGTADQFGAVVGGFDEDAGREAVFEFEEPGFGVFDDLVGIGAEAGNDDAADGFADAVVFADAAAHFAADLDGGDVAKEDGSAAGGGYAGVALCGSHRGVSTAGHAEDDLTDVFDAAEVAAAADHVLVFGEFEGGATDVVIASLDGHHDVFKGKVEGFELQGIDDNLVLLDEATDGGDLGDVFDAGEGVAEVPVL